MASNRMGSTAPVVLIGAVVVVGVALAGWKAASLGAAEAAAAGGPEPVEAVAEAIAAERPYRETTTAIGTVIAPRSITLRNEVSGVVRSVNLKAGQIVDAGTVLVALDVSVEEAELGALEANAELARTTLARLEALRKHDATSAEEVDQARAELDVARAQIERTRAIIARKTIRAPFRARVGLADVHQGQYLEGGTQLTTLQGVGDGSRVDFAIGQSVAASLVPGESIEVFTDQGPAITGRIAAVDARVDPDTRTAQVRATIAGGAPRPGASVRVRVPVAPTDTVITIPASALRRGPAGDHVFVLVADDAGNTRAELRPVQAGTMIGTDVVIIDGLAAGEHVAANGSFKLRPGALVVTAQAGGEQ